MGKMTNKEKILDFLRHESKDGVTTSEISVRLSISRPVVSKWLNELCREGSVFKEGKQPVMYKIRQRSPKNLAEDSFEEVIGYHGSLTSQVTSCKSSVLYPGKGLPILLLGDSGVGKSFIAEHIFTFAKESEVIASHSPFKVLNCADYANNPELLSSALFGYTAGSFTGADKDRSGLFDQADGGYLFLDEVHRLSPEGQEKLFRYLDKGVVSKLGSHEEYNLNVRLIFATTVSESELLETFIRRIPLIVRIPKYSERSVDERYQMICHLFFQEAKKFSQVIEIKPNLMNWLIQFDGRGNIGVIKNIIKVACAKAANFSQGSSMSVSIREIENPKNFTHSIGSFIHKSTIIQPDDEEVNLSRVSATNDYDRVNKWMIEIKSQLNENRDIDTEFSRFIRDKVGKMIREIKKKELDVNSEQIYSTIVSNILDYLDTNYGFAQSSQHTFFFVRFILDINTHLIDQEFDESIYAEFLRSIKSSMYKFYKMAKVFAELVRINLDMDIQTNQFLAICTLYFFYYNSNDETFPYVLMVCHGNSTATSISSITNQVYSHYLFDSLDMPFHSSKEEVLVKIKKRLRNIDTSKGVLIFVDMGSLTSIGDSLADEVAGELGIMSNITTQVALEAGNFILQKKSIHDILEELSKEMKPVFNYYPAVKKDVALLVSSVTSSKSANKIRKILTKCFANTNVKIEVVDYDLLQHLESRHQIEEQYQKSLIISTLELKSNISGSVSLRDLLDTGGGEIIEELLKDTPDKAKRDQILSIMAKEFTLSNLVEQLTILNPYKLIGDVEEFIGFLEIDLGKEYNAIEKKILFMHISVMIERLILEKDKNIPSFSSHVQETSRNVNSAHEQLVKKRFSALEDKYNISMTAKELHLLLNII